VGIALAAVTLAAGCGTSAKPSAKRPGNAARSSADRFSDPRVAALRAGWKTNFAKFSVPLSEFQPGGPGKDGIPALLHPRFAPVDRIDFLKPREPVIALALNGEARAYPLQILIWHEIANDEVGGIPVAVTFCPLCNTALVFDRRVRGRTLAFGTTGNLRDSDLVMYDRQTESWWQQFGGQAVVGAYTGARLRQLPARIVAWSEFARMYPRGRVLTRDTGYERDYGTNPYVGYDDVSSPPFFAVANENDKRLPPKERVVFVERRGQSVAVPYSTLRKRRLVDVTVGGHRLQIRYRRGVASPLNDIQIAAGRDVGSAEVLENGRPVQFSEPFWFAVAALRPKVVLRR
jgi:hypothetical protein